MKKKATSLVVFLIITILFNSFNINAQDGQTTNNSEFELLVEHLEANGNFINSELTPALISASEIKENLKNEKYLVLDIRSADWFDYGHIKKSKNVKGPEVLDYFENKIDPATYDKITIICYSGQSAAYYTSLLRLYGFNNVYSLKWGMCSWADEFASAWKKNSKDEFTDQLESTSNPKPEKGAMPVLTTGKTDAKEILQTRIKEAFAIPYKEYIVKAPVAFEDPSAYFIINYTSEDNYNLGHIKGAVQYQPKQCLASTASLLTLPTDKKVLVNCDTGLSAAYAVAYLNILGYDAYNLAYGSNSYMNSVLVDENLNGWTTKEIKEFPVVE